MSIAMVVLVARRRNGAINPLESIKARAFTAIAPVLIGRRSMSRTIICKARQWGWDLTALARPSTGTDAVTSIGTVSVLGGMSIAMFVFVALWRNGTIHPLEAISAAAVTAISPVPIGRRSMSGAIT
jgi:hypothetical protein